MGFEDLIIKQFKSAPNKQKEFLVVWYVLCAIATGLHEATGDERGDDVLPTGLWLPPPSSPLTCHLLSVVLGLLTQLILV